MIGYAVLVGLSPKGKRRRILASIPFIVIVLPHFILLFEGVENIPANLLAIAIWGFGFIRLIRGKEKYAGCLIVAILWLGLLFVSSCLFEHLFNPAGSCNTMRNSKYAAEGLPTIGHLKTQIDLFVYEKDHLPFADDETGTVTTWRKTEDGYEPVRFAFGADHNEAVVLSPTNNVLSRMEMPLSDLTGKFVSPDQVQFACLANGSSDKPHSYAIGVFGNRKNNLEPGTGCAVLEAHFPDVEVPASDGGPNHGYKLVATWENFNRLGSVRGEQIRFGLEPEPGVCMLIPPEAFKPSAVTKLRGDEPDSVEYWVERLRSAPCGKWKVPKLPER